MTFDADVTAVADRDRSEQSLLDLPEPRSPRAWSRQAIGNPALSADAGSDFIRARECRRRNSFPPASGALSMPRRCTTTIVRNRTTATKVTVADS